MSPQALPMLQRVSDLRHQVQDVRDLLVELLAASLVSRDARIQMRTAIRQLQSVTSALESLGPDSSGNA